MIETNLSFVCIDAGERLKARFLIDFNTPYSLLLSLFGSNRPHPCPQCPAVHDGLAEPAGLADPHGGFFLPPLGTHAGILAESLAPDPVGCSPSETAWLLGGFG